MSVTLLITFGQRYNHEEHPTLPGVTGEHYILVSGDDWADARQRAFQLTNGAFAFDYPWLGTGSASQESRTRMMVARHHLTEYIVEEEPDVTES